MAENRKMTTKEVANEKAERMMNGVAYWGAFYRKNPQRFCRDFLNVHLKLFQKILSVERNSLKKLMSQYF